MIIYHRQHKTEKAWHGGKAALLLATFSSNDLLVSGRTDGFQAEDNHSAAVRISFSSNYIFNLINFFAIPIPPLVSVYRSKSPFESAQASQISHHYLEVLNVVFF
jgi:hypothetical protein